MTFGHHFLSDTSWCDSLRLALFRVCDSWSGVCRATFHWGVLLDQGGGACGREPSEASVCAGYLPHQVDQIWNHAGDTFLDMHTKRFPERFRRRGNTYPGCGQHCAVDWASGLKKRKENVGQAPALISLCRHSVTDSSCSCPHAPLSGMTHDILMEDHALGMSRDVHGLL